MKLNHIESRLSQRYEENDPDQEGNRNTAFADILIDGHSLYKRLKKFDLVPSLGWGSKEHQQEIIDCFLLKKPFELMYHRYPIAICPWCGDLECGYISVNIDIENDIVTWSNFLHEPDCTKVQTGPYHFKWNNYKRVIEQTFGMAGFE